MSKRFSYQCLIVLCGILVLGAFPISASAETFREALKRAQALEEEDDDEGAIAAYVLAKSMAPNPYNDARLGLARLYTKLGRYSDADPEYAAMLAGTKDKSLKYEYGQFLLNQGKFSASSSIWSELLAENPQDVFSLYHMGACLEGSDNPDSAKDYFEKVVALSPKSSAGQAAQNKLGRLSSALDVRKSAKFFPIDPDLGAAGLGWWDLSKMPIHVYIDDGGETPGYRPEMKNYIYRALEAWRQISAGRIWFTIDPPDQKAEWEWNNAMEKRDPLILIQKDPKSLPADPVKTGIHFHWTDKLGGVAVGLAWTDAYAEKATGKKKKKTDDDSSDDKDSEKKGETEKDKDKDSDKEKDKSSDKEKDKDGKSEKKADKRSLITKAHVWLHTDSLADGSPIPEQINAANSAILDKQDRCMSEVAVHELGHALGLTHSSNPKDIMCSGIFALNSSDLLESRGLSNGDAASLSEHYNGFQGRGFPDSIADTAAGNKVVSISPDTKSESGKTSGSRSTLPPPIAAASNPAMDKFKSVMFEMGSGKFQDALAQLDSLLRADPRNATAHYLRAIALVNLRNYAAAEEEYKLVSKLAPGTELAGKAIAGLKKIAKPKS